MADFIRLLQCRECKTLDVLPDYEGDPEHDDALAFLAEPHASRQHLGKLYRVDARDWNDPTKHAEIEKQIWEQSGITGLDPAFYETKDNLLVDAQKCFSRHGRNADCSDYEHDSKRLTPGTAAERKAAGLGKYHSRRQVYLCHFCPVHSLVRSSRFKKAGLDQ